jgi:hypothetical protein
MPSPAAQRRIDRLKASFAAVLADRSWAERANKPALVEAYGTALKLLDAAIAIEEGEFLHGDVDCVRRLREVAAARDIFGERAAPAEAKTDKAKA